MATVSYPEALQTILDAVPVPGIESVNVRDSLGRILAQDLKVDQDFPDLPRSAVDGYAVQSSLGPIFSVVMEVPAGHLPTRSLQPGQAAAVMTGGVVPEGADCVVMVERCLREGNHLKVESGLVAGAMINGPGHEARQGDGFALAGKRIGAALFSTLFCAGVVEVPVFKRPRLGVLSSGDELREVEEGPSPGKVFNTNRYIIEGICTSLGLNCLTVPSVKDEPDAVARSLDELCRECDFVITSGGVSVGNYDFVRTNLEDGDYQLLVTGTRIKPGRPLHVARRENTMVFAMPGYPSALLTNALLYLVPALKKACGRKDWPSQWLAARTADPLRGRPGKQYLARVILELEGGSWVARDPGSQMSSHFLNFAQVNGLARLPLKAPEGSGDGKGAYVLPVGSALEVLHFDLELT